MNAKDELKGRQAVEGVVAEIHAQTMEAPVFPDQFTSIMRDYAYDTLARHLKEAGVSEVALHLLDDMVILADLREMVARDGGVELHWNQELQECVANISREVDALGGRFSGPFGEEA